MRWALAAALAAAAAAAAPGPARASCALVLDWNGVRYESIGGEAPPLGRALGTGVLPGCDDGNGPRTPDEEVEVRALRTIAPRYAVATVAEHGGVSVFVDRAYPLLLPQHPLHAAVYGNRRSPQCGPATRRTVAGTVVSLADVLHVDTGQAGRIVFVDRRTRMVPRFGRLGRGDRVRVEAVDCRPRVGVPPRLIARRIAVVERAAPDEPSAVDRDVVAGAAITAVLFAAAFGVRALRRRR